LVNNASTDDSGKICDSYAVKNDKIKVIHLELNCLPAGARNVGLRAATGTYVHFCDSDDYYVIDSFSRMAELLSSHAPDVLLGQFICTPEKGAYVCNDIDLNPDVVRNSTSASMAHYLLSLRSLLCTPWRLISSRKLLLLNDLKFTEGYHCEDEEWFIKVICCASKFSLLTNPFYHYCPRAIGSVTAIKSFIHSKSQLVVALNLIYFLNTQHYSDARKDLIVSRVQFLLGLFASRCDTFQPEELQELAEVIAEKEASLQMLRPYSQRGTLYDFVSRYGVMTGLTAYQEFIIETTQAAIDSNKNQEIFIFPTGYSGEGSARILRKANYNIKGFLDNSLYKRESVIEGLPVLSPEILKELPAERAKKVFVLVATQQQGTANEILQQLEVLGLNKTQFTWHYFK
jgi:hypothetical protein